MITLKDDKASKVKDEMENVSRTIGRINCVRTGHDKRLSLFECEDDQHHTPYKLHDNVWQSLFDRMGRAGHPLNEPREDMSAIIPPNERYKKDGEMEIQIESGPTHLRPFIFSAAEPDLRIDKSAIDIGPPYLARCVVSDWMQGIREQHQPDDLPDKG
ncbi:hypothetical protein D9757_006071 [Collybiopsis confluens]|uniref:Uncharacterized protein n=1 Tax=Collybiopsis confluens TaxID=2823264 RepID=A0A8H5HHT8_9AGAR|nr:hypothetical protein D9757_006071 [Collybiopsis confluens]